MNMNKYLDINPEVAAALAEGKPVVALESTIISHGMPYPQNVETALAVEQIIRVAALSVVNLNSGRNVVHPLLRPSSTIRARSPLFAETPPPMVICLIPVCLAALISLSIRMSIRAFWKLAQMSALFFSIKSGSSAIWSRTK